MPEVAQAIGISVSHMNRVFTAVYGMTPAAYHVKCQLDMAANFLVHAGLPVGDISRQLRFTSVRYFSPCFGKESGKSPREYRADNVVTWTAGGW
ncbi:helix-turn-helix transcriptional regulator [Bifidobacterium sp. SO4]|nr:helix-turn-helix transcriptional regulator [Bifidobacterium sp. SO4]